MLPAVKDDAGDSSNKSFVASRAIRSRRPSVKPIAIAAKGKISANPQNRTVKLQDFPQCSVWEGFQFRID